MGDKKKYFGEEQEKAVNDYLNSDCQIERNKIYNKYLRQPLITMTESIIRRYKLFSIEMEYEDLHSDTLSFLLTKISKFDPNKVSAKSGQKVRAYSYFQTIIRNRLLGLRDKEIKNRNNVLLYDDANKTFDGNMKMTYEIDYYLGESFIENLVSKLLVEVENELESGVKLSDNERRVGMGIIDMFSNINQILEENQSNNFNKNLVLKYLREYTFLNTKEIRNALKKYKSIYWIVKKDIVEED